MHTKAQGRAQKGGTKLRIVHAYDPKDMRQEDQVLRPFLSM